MTNRLCDREALADALSASLMEEIHQLDNQVDALMYQERMQECCCVHPYHHARVRSVVEESSAGDSSVVGGDLTGPSGSRVNPIVIVDDDDLDELSDYVSADE